MNEMFRELGKYMLDISKYIFTTVLISMLFSDKSNITLYTITAFTIAVMLLIIGLGFIKDFRKGDKE